MKRWLGIVGILVAVGAATVMAQPPGGRGGRGGPPGGGPPGGPGDDFRPPPNPIIESIDANHDHVISSEEISNATQALRALDKNQDGQLSEDETRPPQPRGGRGGAHRGGPPGDGPGDGPRGDRPQRDGPQRDGPPRDGPQRGGAPRGGFPGDGPRDSGPPGGPPSPDRFVDDAFRFDADQDGKLSREELTKFAEEMANRRPPGDDDRLDDGDRPPRGRFQRPDRPRRPD